MYQVYGKIDEIDSIVDGNLSGLYYDGDIVV